MVGGMRLGSPARTTHRSPICNTLRALDQNGPLVENSYGEYRYEPKVPGFVQTKAGSPKKTKSVRRPDPLTRAFAGDPGVSPAWNPWVQRLRNPLTRSSGLSAAKGRRSGVT